MTLDVILFLPVSPEGAATRDVCTDKETGCSIAESRSFVRWWTLKGLKGLTIHFGWLLYSFTSLVFSCFLYFFRGVAAILCSCSIFACSDLDLENQVRLQLLYMFLTTNIPNDGLEKVESFRIPSFLVSMLDCWGVPYEMLLVFFGEEVPSVHHCFSDNFSSSHLQGPEVDLQPRGSGGYLEKSPSSFFNPEKKKGLTVCVWFFLLVFCWWDFCFKNPFPCN